MTAPADIDLVAVDRLARGQLSPQSATRAELIHAAWLLDRDDIPAADIAQRLGVTPRTVYRWRATPTPGTPAAGDSRWRDRAICREIGGDMWFPPDSDDPVPVRSSNQARAICAACPVRTACLDDAMAREGNADRSDRAGIWGGLSASQRAALAKARVKDPRSPAPAPGTWDERERPRLRLVADDERAAS